MSNTAPQTSPERILLLGRRLAPAGGAERSLRTLAAHLAEDHTVRVCGYAVGETDLEVSIDDASTPTFDVRSATVTDRTPLPVEVARLGRFGELTARFRDVLRDFDPDLVVSQHELSLLGSIARHRHGVPHMTMLHDDAFLPGRAHGTNRITTAINSIVGQVSNQVVEYVFEHTDCVVANSEYTAEQYRRSWNIDPAVVYPLVDRSAVKTETTGDAICHVTPTEHKGIDVTLDVAQELEDRRFVVVGTATDPAVEDRLAALDNVEYRGYVEDMRSVYQDAGLIIMPTRAAEGYGMVPVEAGYNGIPTVHSGAGGLPEAAGEELAVESNAPDDYVSRIRPVFDDYDRYASAAKERAADRTARQQVETFERILSQSVRTAIASHLTTR